MQQSSFIFNQLISFLPRDTFDRMVRKYNGNAYVKSFTCWNHLLVMIWVQLTNRQSLRDIETSLRAHSDKTYRMGMGKYISRNNLASANARRNVGIYRELAMEMMRRQAKLTVRDKTLADIARRFEIEGFFAVDSSTVVLDLEKFPWSVPQQELGGVKMHTMFDLMRSVPRACLITGHEERDQTFMENFPYEPGCFYIFDRMYFKTAGMWHINCMNAYFLTRIKRGVGYEVVSRGAVDGEIVLADDVIRFTKRFAMKGYPEELRLIQFYSTQTNTVIRLVTNNFDLDASTVAMLYKQRWQIELFFKWIKQHLRINTFYGTSGNAVMLQIYTAITAYCLIATAASATKFKGSLYEFANIISVSLTEKCSLQQLIDRYMSQEDQPMQESAEQWLFDYDS